MQDSSAAEDFGPGLGKLIDLRICNKLVL
jgi:hypothetical protein